MSWDASRDRDSGRPRRTDEPKARSVNSRRPNPSSRPPAGLVSQNPRSRSLRSRERSMGPVPAQPLPTVVEEELWFGGHDPAVAEDTAARSMAALVGRIVGAKPFPESARRLAELTRKDVIRIEPIVQVLERDPALSARLLRLVNSAGYALRQRCTSVRHAATLVGTDRLHQIATTAAVLDLFDSRSSIAARIIEHSTIVGAFCRYFGAHLALPVDDLFTAGFLHDIGKLMLLETEGEQYVQLLEKYADQPDTIHVVERSLYGFDHAVLGAHVLTAWNIPDPVPKIVAWHHEPTRAYHVSSMMAALVQTVRLADSAVCAMVRGVTQEEFATLANAECASYLDISEPQLASMWEELQTLYRESIEQCRGENAPALDPRSLRPKQPLSVAAAQDEGRSAELPLQFPCVVCGGPTFGNTCSACGGHMCPAHQVGREDWCTLCARDYHNESSQSPAPVSPRLAGFIGLGTVLISIAFGYETGGAVGGIRAGIGTSMLLVLAAVLVVIGRRYLLRFRFVRTRPDRKIIEALENDGGVKSLVPPTLENSMPSGNGTRDLLSEHIRLSGGMVERVMIRDVPSIPAIIAPRPFDGLSGSPLMSRPPQRTEAAHEAPQPSLSSTRAFDKERVLMQSLSLVTLPAPALSSGGEPHPHESLTDAYANAVDSPSSESDVTHRDLNALAQTSVAPGSLAPIEPSPIEVPKSTSPTSAGAATDPLPPRLEDVAPSQQSEAAEVETPAARPSKSGHPLAALGIAPRGGSKRQTIRDLRSGPSQDLDEPQHADPEPEGRITLLGLTSNAVPEPARELEAIPLQQPTGEAALMGLAAEAGSDLLAAQRDDEPASSPVAIPELRENGATDLDRASVAPEPEPSPNAALAEPEPEPSPEIIPLAKFLKSEPPPLQRAPSSATTEPSPDDLIAPLVAALGPEILNKFGHDFQNKVMEMVAQRVAAAVAEQMLQTLGQASIPVPRAKPARVPMTRPSDSEAPDDKLPVKRSRKRVAKH